MPFAGIRRPPTLNNMPLFTGVSLPCTGRLHGECYLKKPVRRDVGWYPSDSWNPSYRLYIWNTHLGPAIVETQLFPRWSPLLWCHICLRLASHPRVRHPSTVSSKSRPCIPHLQVTSLKVSSLCVRWEKCPSRSFHGLWCKTLTNLSKENLSLISIFLYVSALVPK